MSPLGSTFESFPELNIGAVITVGTEGAGSIINVAVQLIDRDNGNELAERVGIYGYLSDDAYGNSNVASAPDGGWAIGTDGLLIPIVANKAALFITENDGDLDINITHAGANKTMYLVLVMPDGQLYVSGAITTSTLIS
jgi:hypothetical protein